MTEAETNETDRPAADSETTDGSLSVSDAIDAEQSARDASAFVHVGSARDPAIWYCLRDLERVSRSPATATAPDGRPGAHAVARTGERWYHRTAGPDEASPAVALAADLREADLGGSVLTPPSIPHDAALYLEEAGFSLASSDVLSRARAAKSPAERERIERAGAAATAGLEAAATRLDAATAGDGGRLTFEGDPLTAEDLRIVADRAIVEAGAFPAGNTRVAGRGTARTLVAGEPIVLALAPRGPGGYHAPLVRTLVVAGEGGDERRAHVALTGAFRSAEALLSSGRSITVADVERDLEAEIRAFGFEDGIETRVTGVGLEPRERPLRSDEEIGPDAVVRIEAAVAAGGGDVRLADCFAAGEGWLAAPSRSLEPAAFLG